MDQVLTDFTIEPPGVKLSDATPLGTVGPAPIVTSGALDLQNKPTDVALYQVTLPDGHFWRFGAEISAHRDGGTLTTDLSLFDAQGHVIVSSKVGRPDFLQDPYLFAGLTPGTYYIGVSDPENIPGQPGGYDPVTGTPGSVPPTQTGGAFRLHLVAHPEDTPTELLGFGLNWADPLDQSPTSVTLAFSSPLNLDSLRGDPTKGLILQDQNGQTWPLTAVGGDEGLCQYTFLFDQRLPAGQYTLRLPSQGGLTDLAGVHPVAPGEPPDVLATWTVAPGTGRANPNDLGALLHNSVDGVSRSDVIAPGGAVTYRFVVTVPGEYSLQDQYSGGPLAALIAGPHGQVAFDHLSTAVA